MYYKLFLKNLYTGKNLFDSNNRLQDNYQINIYFNQLII